MSLRFAGSPRISDLVISPAIANCGSAQNNKLKKDVELHLVLFPVSEHETD
jgi:hypothetical protein